MNTVYLYARHRKTTSRAKVCKRDAFSSQIFCRCAWYSAASFSRRSFSNSSLLLSSISPLKPVETRQTSLKPSERLDCKTCDMEGPQSQPSSKSSSSSRIFRICSFISSTNSSWYSRSSRAACCEAVSNTSSSDLSKSAKLYANSGEATCQDTNDIHNLPHMEHVTIYKNSIPK